MRSDHCPDHDPDLATDLRNLRDVVTMLLRHQKAQDKAIAAIAKTVDKLAARERRNDVQTKRWGAKAK